MNEMDDRLAGDPVWEIFAHPAPQSAVQNRRSLQWLILAGFVAMCWGLYPPLAVVTACLSVAAPDIRRGRQLAQSIPDKAGGTICSRFTYAWAAWKAGVAAFVLTFGSIPIIAITKEEDVLLPPFFAALLSGIGGFALSAALSALGLIAAYRSGMRVWIGEGVNQARVLLMGMLIVGFAFSVIVPICVWLIGLPLGSENRGDHQPLLLALFVSIFAGPVVILLVLDRISRRVLADRPGKFGPKVPTVGKWNS